MKKFLLFSLVSIFAVSANAQNAPRSFNAGQGTLDSQMQQQQLQQGGFHTQAQQQAQAHTQGQIDSPFGASSGQVLTVQEEELPWLVQKKEPTKNQNNLIRLKFEPSQESLSNDDKTALKSVVNRMLKDFNSKAILKSYATLRGENAIRARQAALRRVLEIRKFLEENGVDFKRFTVQTMGDQENSYGQDYIDIDRL